MITLQLIQQKISDAIKQSGKTQTDIAKLLDIKQPTVGQYISGRAMPSLDTLAKLCAVLDLDANDILCVSDY
ncbi:MAG: helix-turn-helix transcriptional regulator [Clostridia bacterium]|nr:helix-turn-helix transcriptional regulator [Clostridia bacterium]